MRIRDTCWSSSCERESDCCIGGFQSYESLHAPGYFLSTAAGAEAGASSATGYEVGDELATRLTPVTLQRKPSGEKEVPAVKRFAALSSFEEAVGAASYPAAAWFLRPSPGRPELASAVVWPLSEVIDETYSVYFDLQ